MSSQLDFFPDANVYQPTVAELEADAIKAIYNLFVLGHPVACSFSGGKDSAVVTHLVLHCARLAVQNGLTPVVVVMTSNTLIENPEITVHFRAEHSKMRAYGKKHGFKVITKEVQPYFASTFQAKVLTGRGLPSFAGTSSDCSVDLKITPQQRERRKMFAALKSKGLAEVVTVLGTRFFESARRESLMKARGDRPDVPVRNADGELVMSPIAMWTTDDVWEMIGLASSSIVESYSDFEDTRRIYANSMSTSCAVVADALLEGEKKQRLGKCGARTGCFTCLQTEDKSLENLIAFDERYAYARGLNKLNKFLRNTRWDWNRRHWVGRTIKAGYIAIEPDTFHPVMVRDLTRYILQLDHDERERASQAGVAPMFEILPFSMLVGVDALQSLNGVARPFACMADWRDINVRGIRYEIPEIEEVQKTPMPAARFFSVGQSFDETSIHQDWDGIRDPILEALTEDSPCQPELAMTKSGYLAWDADSQDMFSVDAESAEMILEFEMERLAAMHDEGYAAGGIVAGYLWYRNYGVLNLHHSMVSFHDECARRTQWKDRNNMTLEYSIDDLLARALQFHELEPLAAKIWSKKATTDSAQMWLEPITSGNKVIPIRDMSAKPAA